jgi:nitrogen fixation NifU-like protein
VPNNIDDYIKVNSNNESCIDNIDIYIKLNGNIVEDIKFDGEACAISTSATSVMIKLLIGKTIDEVKNLCEEYNNLIETGEEKEDLQEALAYSDIYKQQNRKHCALLPWIGIKKALEKYE